MARRTRYWPVLIVTALGLGCAGDGTGLDENGNPINGGGSGTNPALLTLAADIQPIFTANCALSGCHAGPSPVLGQNLSEGQAFSSIVNVPSVEQPQLRRVRPFMPDSSYLVHKIQGTQASVGGSGARMPLIGGPLAQEQIDLIRAWIEQGALEE